MKRAGIAAGLVVTFAGLGTALACSCRPGSTPESDVAFIGAAVASTTVPGDTGELFVGTFVVEKVVEGEPGDALEVGQEVRVLVGDSTSTCTLPVERDARYIIRADHAGGEQYRFAAKFCGSSQLQDEGSSCSVSAGRANATPPLLLLALMLLPALARARRRPLRAG